MWQTFDYASSSCCRLSKYQNSQIFAQRYCLWSLLFISKACARVKFFSRLFYFFLWHVYGSLDIRPELIHCDIFCLNSYLTPLLSCISVEATFLVFLFFRCSLSTNRNQKQTSPSKQRQSCRQSGIFLWHTYSHKLLYKYSRALISLPAWAIRKLPRGHFDCCIVCIMYLRMYCVTRNKNPVDNALYVCECLPHRHCTVMSRVQISTSLPADGCAKFIAIKIF